MPPRYPLVELPEGGYPERTLRNVEDSEATAIIHFGPLGGGTEDTLRFCRERGRPHVLVDGAVLSVEEGAARLLDLCQHHGVSVLNIAGPRRGEAPAGHDYARRCVGLLLDRTAPA